MRIRAQGFVLVDVVLELNLLLDYSLRKKKNTAMKLKVKEN